jgi:hypothetical protein
LNPLLLVVASAADADAFVDALNLAYFQFPRRIVMSQPRKRHKTASDYPVASASPNR